MIESSPHTHSFPAKLQSRSMGMKLIVVCLLALLMAIPALFVRGLIEDRTSRAAEVIREISAHVGGQQTFLGPTLAVPYSIAPQTSVETVQHGVYFVSPAHGSARIKTTTEERRRSLFTVPVFKADIKFDSMFDLTGVPASAPTGAELDWSRAEILVGVSDPRGALADATLTANGQTSTLVPSAMLPSISLAVDQPQHLRMVLFGTAASGLVRPDAQFTVTSTLRFSGAQRIALLAYAKATQASVQGSWPSPGFDGGFLPINRTVSNKGFSAEWSVPFLARGVRAEGPADAIAGLESTALGVSFVEVADPYQSVSRSLKYALLFLGLVFLTYFIFEVTTGKCVHSALYVLVGLAQSIFYLLLLSLSERVGFDLGFFLAGTATVALLSANAEWVFESRRQGVRALFSFSLLYVLIYLMLRLEDNALLVGAIASFLIVALAMYLTRHIDWYSSSATTTYTEQREPTP